MTVKYPTWINKIEGAAQTPEEMNGIVEVLQNHAETLSLHDIRILAATSGYFGIATTTTTPPATGVYWYRVDTAGTYTNFKGSGNTAIVVTATDLDVVNGVANNRVILEVNNGVATKRVERVKGDTGVANPDFNPANDTEAPTMKGVADYMPLYEVGKNKLNKHTFVADRVLNSSGGVDTSASWNTTGFLEIPPNTEISIKEARYFAQYDTNKNFISGTLNNNTSSGNITLTTNANTRFFRMTAYSTKVNLAMVEIGSSVTAYEDYKVTVVKRKYDNAPLKFAPLMNETAASDLEPFTLQSRLRDYILSESFTISSATYTDGIINSPILVKYPDEATGTLTITRNTDLAVTKIVATHIKSGVTTTVTLNITRNSDNNVTLITIL